MTDIEVSRSFKLKSVCRLPLYLCQIIAPLDWKMRSLEMTCKSRGECLLAWLNSKLLDGSPVSEPCRAGCSHQNAGTGFFSASSATKVTSFSSLLNVNLFGGPGHLPLPCSALSPLSLLLGELPISFPLIAQKK